MADVFISHRTADTGQAERLQSDLARLGHRVWLDSLELTIGDSILAHINARLSTASHLLLCISSAGVDAPWVSREWLSSLARQLNGARIKLLPVLLPGGAMPPIIADIKYADLTADWAAGVDQLDEALHR